MDRYTLGFLIFCGWFVVFRMFPTSIGEHSPHDTIAIGTDHSSYGTSSLAPDSEGKKIFVANCARCHNTALEKASTGPGLMGVGGRIPGGDWIYNWVRNSGKLIASGELYAVKIWEANNKADMPPFPALTNEMIDEIMAYINSYSSAPVYACY
jgi:hypothetical protein